MDPKLFPRTPRSDLNPEVADINVIDGPRDKTTDAGESPEWGKGHGNICGDHMTSICDEKVDLGNDKHTFLIFYT